MGFFKEDEPKRYTVAGGRPLICLVCGNDHFRTRQAQLNTAAASFFDLDWANKSADCFVCANCGYIHWFLFEH